MKKLAFAFLFAALPALAGSYTVVTTTTQDPRFTRDMNKLNAATCAAYGLPASCTQGQVKTAFCAQEGSSGATPPCTVNGVSSNTLTIYTDIGIYLDRYVIDTYYRNLLRDQNSEDFAALLAIINGGTVAQKNALCQAAGLAAGCLP
jgi:hypothetical protein